MRAHPPASLRAAYDAWFGTFDPAAITALHTLAGTGPALELGIGTGRIALPLAERGVALHGIDVAPAMVAQLRAKPGGDRIPVTIGDFADVAAEGTFALIYVVFNTFFGLLTQDDQLRCFQNVARRLAPGGVFVIEAFVPDVARFSGGQAVRAAGVSVDAVRLDVTQHDPVTQRLTSQHIVLAADGVRLYPVQIRYAWPDELDLMARLAGLRLQQRWGSWERGPFTASSPRHISIYAADVPTAMPG